MTLELREPTDDVAATYALLLEKGFSVRSAIGGGRESFGNQHVVLDNGEMIVEFTRDRSQWSLSLRPADWQRCRDLDAVLIACGELRAEAGLDTSPTRQLPPGVSWAETLPRVLIWVGAAHREVFVDAAQHHRARLAFGGRPPSLRRLSAWTKQLGGAIDCPSFLFPTFGRSADMARPHVESGREQLHYVVVERGQELDRRSTPDPNVLLWWIFEAVTFSIATDWESRRRNPSEDFRRRLWAKQLVLLHELNPIWAEGLVRDKRMRFAEVGLDAVEADQIVRAIESTPAALHSE